MNFHSSILFSRKKKKKTTQNVPMLLMCKAGPVSALFWLLPKRQQWNQHCSVQKSLCLYCCLYSPQPENYLLSNTLLNSQRACLWVMSIFSDIMSLRAGCSFSCFCVQFLSAPGLCLQVTCAFFTLCPTFSNTSADVWRWTGILYKQ